MTVTTHVHTRFLRLLRMPALHLTWESPSGFDSNVSDFKRHGKTRFTKDNFVEDIDFDFLEMHVIEED